MPSPSRLANILANQYANPAMGTPDANGNIPYANGDGWFTPVSAETQQANGMRSIVNPVTNNTSYIKPQGLDTSGMWTYDPQQVSSLGYSDGGLIHKPDTWNQTTGQYDSGGINWGALGSLMGLGAIGGGAMLAYAPAAATIDASTAGVGGGTAGPLSGGLVAPATEATAEASVPASLSATAPLASTTPVTSLITTPSITAPSLSGSTFGSIMNSKLGQQLISRAVNKVVSPGQPNQQANPNNYWQQLNNSNTSYYPNQFTTSQTQTKTTPPPPSPSNIPLNMGRF